MEGKGKVKKQKKSVANKFNMNHLYNKTFAFI